MNVLTYKGHLARVEFDAEDEILVGHLAGINTIVGFHADTVADLKAAFHEAVDDYLQACAETGKTPEKPFSVKVMFRVPPEVRAQAALAAELGQEPEPAGRGGLAREGAAQLAKPSGGVTASP